MWLLGKTHFLLRKIKKLFQHILDVLQEVPAFSSDYSHILRELLPDVEYRLRMSKKIYNGIVTEFSLVRLVVFLGSSDFSPHFYDYRVMSFVCV